MLVRMELGLATFADLSPGVTPASDYSNAVYSETDPVRGGMASTATGYTLPTNGTVTGTYHWFAAYSGDGNNNSDRVGIANRCHLFGVGIAVSVSGHRWHAALEPRRFPLRSVFALAVRKHDHHHWWYRWSE